MLGEGTFGVVVKARDPEAPSGGEIAIKLLPRGDFVRPSHLAPALACLAPACPLTTFRQAATGGWHTGFSWHAVTCFGWSQVKNFKTYVKREIVHQSSLKHPFIVSLKEVRLGELTLRLATWHRPLPSMPHNRQCWKALSLCREVVQTLGLAAA